MGFWEVHGILFIICMLFFPRLTMLFSGIFMSWISPLFFFGWLLVPRITVAILATCVYWTTNPVLCVFTWLWALGGESTEKNVIKKRRFSD